MKCIQTLSQGQILCVSVSLWGRDDMWQISEVYIGWQVNWVLVIASQVVLSAIAPGVFPVLGKFWRAFRRKVEAFVQGKLSCKSKLLCWAVYDWLSFLPFKNWLHYCLICSLFIFHSGVADRVGFCRRHRYGSCLLTQANISRLGLCLMRIAPKLIHFLFLK